jgi:uncharacterized membrane protein
MATLVVFEFPTAEGADTMLYTLEGLQKQQLIQINDGAVVTWPAGASKPKTRQLSRCTVRHYDRREFCAKAEWEK